MIRKTIRSFFESLEDPKRPLLGPNWLLLTKVGFMFPKTKLGNFFAFASLQILHVVLAAAFFELYLVRSDKNTVLDNLKMSTMGCVCMAKANSFMIYKKKWKQVIDYITESDKYERQTRDKTQRRIIDKYTKQCRRITYGYAGMMYVTFFTNVCNPITAYMSSETLREDIRNGTKPFPHMISNWMPFDKNHYPGNVITMLIHAYIHARAIGLGSAIDTVLLSMIVFFGGKMELLQERCKQLLEKGKTISDEEFNKSIGEVHQSHMMLLKHMKLFNSLISPVMFIFIIVCSMMICASTYQVITATSTVEAFVFTVFLVSVMTQLYLFCWFSSDSVAKNEKLMRGPYESQWWAANARQRKSIMILAGQLSIIHNFSAGPFTNISLSMFVSVIKGAYSYFTLLRD